MFSEWFKEVKELAEDEGLTDLVGACHYHVDSYAGGATPAQELIRIKAGINEWLGYDG